MFDCLDKLPEAVRCGINNIKRGITNEPEYRKLHMAMGKGYIEALRDAGLITEKEHNDLKAYIIISWHGRNDIIP